MVQAVAVVLGVVPGHGLPDVAVATVTSEGPEHRAAGLDDGTRFDCWRQTHGQVGDKNHLQDAVHGG